ncbi:diadenylate cyclase [Acidovorax sp. sic0104]|uniref:diadenylate cyclase n=1 Tax=Acidovorax sp. sic0104 TaxID=2854784 RepID=UPI001C43BFB9|nr:diadenylate cyclase [Acidovorax sp. sic0104]
MPIDPEKYQQISILESAKIDNDEALKDAVRFIASLSAVDGALVITDRFRVLGFGAEVIAQSPTLRDVQIAMNPEATTKQPVSIETYGTRHRSAFRFCSTYEDGIAFIVSSDGGVKATKRIGSEVLLWPEVQPSFWDA